LQKLAAERNTGLPDESRMEWRIGIHLGDVLVEGDDILGDGVNIAARLEGIAEPGGICISEDAFRQVRGKIEAEFADIGEQALKNIARPMRIYALNAPSAPAVTERYTVHPSASQRRAIIAAGVATLIGIGVSSWWVWLHRSAPAVTLPTASQLTPPVVTGTQTKPAPRLSFIVLPFENLSKGPGQEYFADWVTVELTNDLS